MNDINRDQYTIGYFSVGDKTKPAIFVIGSTVYYPRIFDDKVFADLHLVFIDHRGFLEPREKESSGDYLEKMLDNIVEDIEAVRVAMDLDKIYVLGHSGHGFMTMAYTDKYSEHVLGLILSNLAPTNTQERNEQSIRFFEAVAGEERRERFYSQIVHLASDIEKDPRNKFTHMNVRTQAQSFYNFYFNNKDLWNGVYNNIEVLDYLWGVAFAKYETETFLKKTNVPVLLLQSRYDYLIAPMSLWDGMIEKYNLKTFVFEKSGHNPMFEEPLLYKEQLENFVK